jgi:hypothetical protein
MSCLSTDTLSHFEQREQELLALNQELEQKRAKAVAEASGAVQHAESTMQRREWQRAKDGDVSSMPSQIGTEVLASASPEAALANALVSGAVPRSSSKQSAAGGEGGSEALHETIRAQHLRILALQEELSKTISELAARNSDAHELRQKLNQANVEKERLQKINAAGEQEQERGKKKLAELDRKLEEAMREKSEVVKEREQLDVRRRKLEAELVSKDARVNRLAEECERYKTAAKDLSSQDKDRAASDRRETDRLTAEVRKLERQRAELVNAFKKQMKLIDVLKRQRAHVEAARLLSFTEDEFIRILELGDKLGE